MEEKNVITKPAEEKVTLVDRRRKGMELERAVKHTNTI
jgi:hypothetical protein